MVSISEDVFRGKHYHLAELAQLVDGQFVNIAEYADVEHASFHVLFLECFEVVECYLGKKLEDFATRVVVISESLVGQVAESHIVVDVALGAATGVESGLCKLE